MVAGRHFDFNPTGNGAASENPTLEPNMNGISWRVGELCEWTLRSLVGRWSIVNIHTSYTDLIYSSFATLGRHRTRSKNQCRQAGIAGVTSLKILGVTFTDKLSVSEHVDDVISSSARSLYAIRVLRHMKWQN